jgi:hypothetical protein
MSISVLHYVAHPIGEDQEIMKNILLTFAVTTALYGAVVYSLLHYDLYFLLSRTDMSSLQEQFEQVYNEGFKAYQLYLRCKEST